HRPRAGGGADRAAAGRAGRRDERRGDRGDGPHHPGRAGRARHLGAAGGARHGAGDGDRRPGHRARLRPADRGRHPAGRAARPRGDPGLPGRRRREQQPRGGAGVSTFLQLPVNGPGEGAVYALLALGFVVIFKATEVVNFAHGPLALLGGYLVVVSRDTLGWAGAAAVGVAGAALAAVAVERLLLARARLAHPDSPALL